MEDNSNCEKDKLMDEKTVPPPQSADPLPHKDGIPYNQQPTIVTHGGVPPPVGFAPPRPKDYIIHAVLVILCCFWPLGVIAFYKAYQARKYYQEGQYAQAESSSKDAQQFTKYGCIIGCLLQGITWGIIVVVYGAIGITFGVLAAVGAFDNATKTS